MRYPTHLNTIQTNLSPIMNLVNRVLDLSGTDFSASNIDYNPNTSRQLNITIPLSCPIKSAIRVDGNRSTELKKSNEIFTFDSAVIKDILPTRDQSGTVLNLFNNIIEFTNPRISIPTSVISTVGGKVQGIINTTAVITNTETKITNIVGVLTPPPSTWEFTVNSSAGFRVNTNIQVQNVGTTGLAPSPFNTTSIIIATVSAIPNSTTVLITYSGVGSVNPSGNPGRPTPVVQESSTLISSTVTITNAFIYLQELNITISGGKGIPDLSGAYAPALVSASDDSLYFAFISRYKSNISYSPLAYSNSLYDIVLGHISPAGAVDWIHRLPGLVTTREESTPVLAIGDQNEIYLAYMTTGATTGSLNGYDIYTDSGLFGICGCPDPTSCTNCGYEDIVLARINPIGASSTTPPTIVWKLQNGFINSTYRETKPSISLDTTNQLIYLAYQCNKNLACFTHDGSSNILLHCFTMGRGQHLWVKAQKEINSAGANTNPSVASDNLGNVYVAYEVTAPSSRAVSVDGGAAVPANEKQIEVVRFQTVLSTPSEANTYKETTTYAYGTWVYYTRTARWYQAKMESIIGISPGAPQWSEPYPVNIFFVQRMWVLSQSVNIFARDGFNEDNASQPTIVADRTNGCVFLSFLTTGSVMDYTTDRSSRVRDHDLVVMSFTKEAVVRWFHQGGQLFNPTEIKYNDCDAPYMTMDRYGNLLFSLVTILDTEEVNAAIFHWTQEGNSRWEYPQTELINYPVYMWARTNSPNAVFPTSPRGSFSKIGIAKSYTNIFLGTITDLIAPGQIQVGAAGIINMACISRFNESIYYKDRNAFSYMLDIRSICTCGNENCGCY